MTPKEWAEKLEKLIEDAEKDGVFIETGTCCSCLTWVEIYSRGEWQNMIKVGC